MGGILARADHGRRVDGGFADYLHVQVVQNLPLVVALHPPRRRRLRELVRDAHAHVVESPVAEPLEEVRLAVAVLEGGVYVVTDALPHRHVARIVQLNLVRVLIEPPVEPATVQIRAIVVTPNQCRIDTLDALRKAQVGKRFRIARLEILRVEDVILFTYRGNENQ